MANSTSVGTSQWIYHRWYWVTVPVKFLLCVLHPDWGLVLFMVPLVFLGLRDGAVGSLFTRLRYDW